MLRKRLIVGGVIIILIIVFLVTLLVLQYKQNEILKAHNKELQDTNNKWQLDNANLVIERELLYRNLDGINKTLKNQTKIVKELTKQLSKKPYLIKVPCD